MGDGLWWKKPYAQESWPVIAHGRMMLKPGERFNPFRVDKIGGTMTQLKSKPSAAAMFPQRHLTSF
jgi:hypothetical protein